MTASATSTAPPATRMVPAAGASGPARPGLVRLTGVELRKLADTRAGYWLLIVIGLATAAVMAAMLFGAPDAEQTFVNFFGLSSVPTAFLLPILGILLVTSEFSQRTALTTFALVPQRHRVVVAKLAASVVAALVSVLASLALAALGNLLAKATGGSGDWSVEATLLAGMALSQVISVLMGMGFGLLLQNAPLAIVLSLLLPTVLSVLAEMIRAMRGVAQWIDIWATSTPLGDVSTGGELTSGQWARLGVSVAVWVLVPIAAGLVRTMRREVS